MLTHYSDPIKPVGLFFRSNIFRRVFLVAAPLAICLLLFFPAVSEAHAILLRSVPGKDAVLSVAPSQVQMWFSEDLNPSFSTAAVINASSQRVDNGDAHVSPNDSTEMDLTLKPNLPPAVYIVLWRSDSNADGHVLRGSFIFSVANPDGTVPKLSGGTIPGQDILGGGNSTGLYTGQFDGPTFFNFIAITLVELGAVFWVGAQLWHILVLQLVTSEDEEQSSLHKGVHRRFEQRFSLPVLLVLFVANIGVLLGQAINLTGSQWASAFSLSVLGGLITSGSFGPYWLMREIVIALAILLALLLPPDWPINRRWAAKELIGAPQAPLRPLRLFKQRPQAVNKLLPWANLILGLALFIAITMSGHAAAVSKSIVVYAIVIDWLHLLASALWVGGMMYVATIYLPTIRRGSIAERAQSLITVLPYYTPWALIGVLIMAITGPFSATFHLSSWDQFLTTAYGRALTVKILLVGALLITSAIHVLLLRPRVAKEYKKYAYAVERLEHRSMNWPSTRGKQEPDRTVKQLSQQVKLREERLTKRTQRLTNVLRWEPLLGVAVLVCVGLMNVFAGTLSPTAVAPQQQQQSTTAPKPFHRTLETSDGKFTVALTVNPNRFGPNLFTVNVVDNATHKPTTDVGVSLYTTMLDMDMGTDTVNLKPDGQGNFKATADLSMGGNWEIRIQIRTPDNQLHEAKVTLFTPF